MFALSENTSDRVKLLTLCLVVRNIKISCVFRIHLHALPYFGTLLVEFFIFTSRKCMLKKRAKVVSCHAGACSWLLIL